MKNYTNLVGPVRVVHDNFTVLLDDETMSCLILSYKREWREHVSLSVFVSGTIKRGPLSKNQKNCLDLVNIEAKRQPQANPHLIRGSAGTPGPPRTISGLTRSGLGPERNHEASDEVPVFRLARGPAPQGLRRGTDSPTRPRPRNTRPRTSTQLPTRSRPARHQPRHRRLDRLL